MNNQNENVVPADKLIQDLGKAIEGVDAKLMDINGGLVDPGDGGGDVIICVSKCA